MTRAALYARYSSDLQSDTSIEDQFRLCREHAKRSGLEVVAEYADAAKSGASLFGRDGAFDLMADAQAGRFEVVIVESLDRLSRDQEDLARLYKRLSFKGIKIEQVHGGRADEIQVGVRGLLGALYLKDLADKTRRGLAGKVASGQSAGGKAYGYRPVKGEPGQLEIVDEEAEIVRRIFDEYAKGTGARQIAIRLNRDGIPSPRGGVWATNTLLGDKTRMSGILRVPLYRGEYVWNKSHYLKDPETGKRVWRLNPPEEWQRADAPHLRIVREPIWRKVQERIGETSRGGKGRARGERLLSGVIRCGVCGGGMIVAGISEGRARIRCARSREEACSHVRSYFLDKVEAEVASRFRVLLESPEAVKEIIEASSATRRKQIQGMAKERARAESDLMRAEAKVGRLIDLASNGTITMEAAKVRIAEAQREADQARACLAGTEKPPVVDLHAAGTMDHSALLDKMAERLKDGGQLSAGFKESLRALLHAVVVFETAPHEEMRIEIEGDAFALSGDGLAIKGVAGACFEQYSGNDFNALNRRRA